MQYQPDLNSTLLNANDAVDFVRRHLEARRIEVLFDGNLFFRDQPLQAITADDVDAVLAVDPPSLADILDELVLLARSRDTDLRKGELSAALRQILRQEMNRRKITVMSPLLKNPESHDQERAPAEWERVGGLFDMDRALAIAILQHFIWGTKQKALRRTPEYHCMPIVFSTVQGTGKTVFLKKFLAPLRELASDAALFSDLADRRSGDIFRFPVVFLDDMERIPATLVPVLKAVLTAN